MRKTKLAKIKIPANSKVGHPVAGVLYSLRGTGGYMCPWYLPPLSGDTNRCLDEVWLFKIKVKKKLYKSKDLKGNQKLCQVKSTEPVCRDPKAKAAVCKVFLKSLLK